MVQSGRALIQSAVFADREHEPERHTSVASEWRAKGKAALHFDEGRKMSTGRSQSAV